MNIHRGSVWVLVLTGALAASCGSMQHSDGGPCKYEPVQGPCHLESHHAGAESDDGTHYFLEYRTTKPERRVRQSLFIPKGEESKLDAFIEKYEQVECSGSVIVTGTCTPEEMRFDMPHTVGALESEELQQESRSEQAP